MNSDTAAAKPHVLAALRRADNVIGVADSHGWARPQGYVDALAMLNSCREAARAVPALPPPPVKPKDIAKWVDATVAVRHEELTRRDVIDELVLNWERETAAAGLAATTDICARLATVFDELVEKFDTHVDAARQLNGHETEDEIAAHTAALRTAYELSNVLMQRAQIAGAAAEAEDIGGDIIWLVIDPTADATRDQVNDALATFKNSVPQTLAEWDSIRTIGLRLARVGEVAARRQRHSDFSWRIAHETPDMGQRDHSYGEIENNPAGPAYGAARQAESDYMFANSPSISI